MTRATIKFSAGCLIRRSVHRYLKAMPLDGVNRMHVRESPGLIRSHFRIVLEGNETAVKNVAERLKALCS